MLTYSAEHDASKVMIGMEKSQKLHICGGYRPRFDNFGMDCVHSTTLYVNVRHHRIFERRSRPVRDADQIIGRVFSFSDATERKAIEQQLSNQNARLEEQVLQRTAALSH